MLFSLSPQTFQKVVFLLFFRISRFVSEKEQSSVLIGLLLPYLQRANNPQVGLQIKSIAVQFVGGKQRNVECVVPSLVDLMKLLLRDGCRRQKSTSWPRCRTCCDRAWSHLPSCSRSASSSPSSRTSCPGRPSPMSSRYKRAEHLSLHLFSLILQIVHFHLVHLIKCFFLFC